MALCYNFSRVLNILGLKRFMERIANALSSPPRAPTALPRLVHAALSRFWSSFPSPFALCRHTLSCTS